MQELNQAGERRRMRVYGMQNDAPTDDEDVGSAAGMYDDDVSGSGVEEAGVVMVPEAGQRNKTSFKMDCDQAD